MAKTVKYLGESDPLELLKDKEYEVMSEEYGCYRITDETGDDYLFPKDWFEIVKED